MTSNTKQSEKLIKNLKHSKKTFNKKAIIITAISLLIVVFGIKFVKSQLKDNRLNEDYSISQNQKRLTTNNRSTKKVLLYKDDSERFKLSKNRLNVLLAGIGGEGHDGGYLTDTIVFASIDTKTSQLAMLTIPRDLYVDLGEDYGYQKINAANAFGEQLTPGKGMEFTREIVEQITGQPIQYYFRVDFNGFESIINTLGGIGVNVSKGFTDEQYPTENYGYKTITFEPGYQIMDGKTALEFSRSRHGNNGEDSDFARSARQLKIILGIKEKVSSLNSMTPTKIISLLSELRKNTETNLGIKDIQTLLKTFKNIDISTSINRSLSDTSGYVYITKTASGMSIVKPVGNSYDLIQDLAANIFDKDYSIKNNKKMDLPNAIVLNGTNKPGLASRVAEQIKNTGDFQVILVGNASNRNQENTVIYDTSEEIELDKISTLNQKIKGKITSTRLNIFNSNDTITMTTTADVVNLNTLKKTYTNSDLVIILGNDFVENL